jgi:hypothetical protein
MRAATQRTTPEFELALARFIEDFEDIIREHVQRAVKERLGTRGRGRGRVSKRGSKRAEAAESKRDVKAPSKRGAKGGGAAKKKASRTQPKSQRNPDQLSLF